MGRPQRVGSLATKALAGAPGWSLLGTARVHCVKGLLSGKRELPPVASESAQVKPAIGAVEGWGTAEGRQRPGHC